MNGIPPLASAASLVPAERLAILHREGPGRIVFSASFGIEDQAVSHLIFTALVRTKVAA